MTTSSPRPDASTARAADPAETPADEARALAELVGDALAGLTRAVAAAHGELSAVVDHAVPSALRSVRPLSAASTRGVYSTLAASLATAPVLYAEVASRTGWPQPPAPSRSPRGRAFLAAVNALWAPLTAAHPELEIDFAVRVDHQDVVLTPDAVAAAFPAATGHLVVFVHGMALDEDCWNRPSVGGPEPGRTYGAVVAGLGATAVYVRYNSGAAVEENARTVAVALDALVQAWPVPVTEVTLVGHSMGGLVCVGAVRSATQLNLPWVERLAHVVTLGTPHHGAPLARALRAGNEVAARVPVAGPVVEWIRMRTDGGADLCDDPHRADGDPAPAGATIPVTAVSATRYGGPDAWAGRLLGDGLVPVDSARASAATALDVDAVHIDGAGHLDLLNHPVVADLLARLLGEAQP